MDKQSWNIIKASHDPMCVPQVWDHLRGEGETFAQCYRWFIESQLKDDEHWNDPMNLAAIYSETAMGKDKRKYTQKNPIVGVRFSPEHLKVIDKTCAKKRWSRASLIAWCAEQQLGLKLDRSGPGRRSGKFGEG